MGRSTRNKIRYQFELAVATLDRTLNHMKNADDLAEGKSDVLNKSMPTIVESISTVARLLARVRENL